MFKTGLGPFWEGELSEMSLAGNFGEPAMM